MKLAEGLALRAELQRRLSSLSERAQANALRQEGETPAEDARALLTEAEQVLNELENLIAAINTANAGSRLEELGLSATQALAHRDVLRARHALYSKVADAATGRTMARRQLRSELKFVTTVDVEDLRRKADVTARELRELDARIQQFNWTVDLQL